MYIYMCLVTCVSAAVSFQVVTLGDAAIPENDLHEVNNSTFSANHIIDNKKEIPTMTLNDKDYSKNGTTRASSADANTELEILPTNSSSKDSNINNHSTLSSDFFDDNINKSKISEITEKYLSLDNIPSTFSTIEDLYPDDDSETYSYLYPEDELMKLVEENDLTNETFDLDISKIMKDYNLSNPEIDHLSDLLLSIHQKNKIENENPNKFHKTLNFGYAYVVTSPYYPEPYPKNQTVDWYLEGNGTGIELNITELDINDTNHDYLLITPGDTVDPSNAMFFTSKFKSEKRYRFLDVNSLFIRFKANSGEGENKGFILSVRLIEPINGNKTIPDSDYPEEKRVVESYSVNLALTIPQFIAVKEEFRQLIAKMAEDYILDNGIDAGLNSTLDVTDVVHVTICNIEWPKYEDCAEVSFGVGLVYKNDHPSRLTAEDLQDMWRSLFNQEPYKSALSNLGIHEFSIPNDEAMMAIWLIMGTVALLCTVLLSAAIWRSNCFQDYHKMGSSGDTDSIRKERRSLNLYPTPHQTLPPLYSDEWLDQEEQDYTDMRGYNNRSYAKDSDERNYGLYQKSDISPRDFYKV